LSIADVDYDGSTKRVVQNDYQLYFGWGFCESQSCSGVREMVRATGEKLDFQGREFSVLAADTYKMWTDISPDAQDSTHPDGDGIISNTDIYDWNEGTSSVWRGRTNAMHGAIKRNFVFTDGSARTLTMEWNDPAFQKVPQRADYVSPVSARWGLLPYD
jgi:hypothetical protein